MSSKLIALVSAALLIGSAAAAPNANAIGRITNVYTSTGGTTGPTAKGYRGSYVKTQTVWGDGIEHINEVGTQFNTVYYVTGATYEACHDALIDAVDINHPSSWTDCSAY